MKKFFIFVFPVLLIVSALSGYFLFKDKFSPTTESQTTAEQAEPIAKDEPIVTCKPGDDACAIKNEKIKINKLTGTSATFAKHQCDGPRACPTPNPEIESEAKDAIMTFANEENLELLRLTGINPAGMVYYCTADSRCWSYDTKEKKVVDELKDEPSEAPEPSEEVN